MKICSTCKTSKPYTEFHRRKKEIDGYNPQCKSCKRNYEKAYRNSNKDKITQIRKKCYENNKENRIEKVKKYRSKNKVKILEYSKKYYKNNKEKFIQYYENNKNYIKEYMKGYNSNPKNIQKRKEYKKLEYGKKYGMEKDPIFTLKLLIRNRIKQALVKGYKSTSSINLLGCSIEEYKLYLEQQFDDKMNWGNYGIYWEIDHIIPCASFDLSKLEEQKKCFNYKNTQPLNIIENRIKSNKTYL